MEQYVAAIIFYKDKVVIGKKFNKEGHFVSGGWHIPGGHLLNNESEKEGIIREYFEETSLPIVIQKKLCVHRLPQFNAIIHWFIGTTTYETAVPGDDLQEIKFVEKNRVLEECDTRAINRWPQEVINFLKL